MSSVNVNALKSVIDLATSDCKFVEMLDLFKCHVPDLEALDFFQPNSRLRDLEPALLTNFHMYSVLYFHYLRYGTKFGKSFIGRITNTKKSDPGLYFSRDHVLSLCSLILKQKITNVNMLKIWQTLDRKFKSCKTEESSKFIGDSPFEIELIIPGFTSSSEVRNSDRLAGVKCKPASPLDEPVTCPAKRAKKTVPKVANCKSPAIIPNVKPRQLAKNFKFVHRSTVTRQAARITSLKMKNSAAMHELTEKKVEILELTSVLKNLQAEHSKLTLKFEEFTSMHETVCHTNNKFRKELEDCKNEVRYLSNKLLELEDLQSTVSHVENKIDDPDFEIDSAISKANDDFEAGNFPKIVVRNSTKDINPKIPLAIILIRNIGRVSLENTMPLLCALANSVFGQTWDLGNFTPKTKQRHALPPSQNKDQEKPPKKKISEYTLPAKSYTRSLEKNVVEPASLRSSALALKECDVGTLLFDHLSINRGKAITVGVTTGKVDPETNQKKTKYMNLAIKQVVDTTAKGTYRSVVEILRLAAAAAADSGSAEDVQKSFKELLAKLKFQVTDDASQMRSVCEKFNELIQLLGIDGEMIYIHCNAHIVPAIDSGVTKVLIDVENFLQISDQMVRSYNQSFHKVSNSTIETMLRAIFKFIGDCNKNESWAMTNQFQTFLDLTGAGDKNFFKNPDSSRFGLLQEMSFILFYSFDNVSEFISKVHASNNMYKSCALYIQCPYFKECICAITLLFYHVTAPFLVAVGAETQYGYSNLAHSELLEFFPQFVSSLEKLTEDPDPYFQPKRLKFLEKFEKICKISRKKYREMFETIFERINNPCELNLDIVKTILKLLTEEYLIVIDRQAKEFYIGDDCVLAQQMKKHKDIIDLVATTSLSCEHSVGQCREDLKRAPCALICTLSGSQTFKTSPFGEKTLKGNMTAKELGEIMKDTRNSGAVKLKKELTANDANVLNQEKKEYFAKLEAEKRKVVQKKNDIAAEVKKHGGPLQTPEEVDEMCQKYTDLKEQEKIIDLELSYQKTVICNNTVSDSRYRLRTKNKVTNKFDKVPLEVKIVNLKAVVKPLDQASQFVFTEPADFIEKANAKLKEKQTYPHRTSDIQGVVNSQLSVGDPFFDNLHTQTFIAVHCIEEAEIWYAAKIISVHKNKDCQECSPLAIFHGDYPYCFKVQFMEKVKNSKDVYDLQSPFYHVPASQVIPCLPHVVIQAGTGKAKTKNNRLKFIIGNEDLILEALEKNILYAYRKAANDQ